MSKIKYLFQELRAPFFTASILPVLLGTAIAYYHTREINWFYFLLALIGGVSLHAGTNIANDYFDHLSGNDEANTEYIRPFSGGSRLIQGGQLKPLEVLGEALFFFAIGSVIGLYFLYIFGWKIFWIGAVGLFSAAFYTAPPFKLGYRGIGEFIVGINFGTLMVLGSYLVQTGNYSIEAIVASIAVTILIAAVLFINEFPDYKADKAVNKRHLVVLLGREKAVYGYMLMILAAYLSVLFGVIYYAMPIYCLAVLLTAPLAVQAMMVAKKYYNDPIRMVPANGITIALHALFGVILIISYMVGSR
ncbi:MAG: 1,4-dihydroxy-2-naphthoate octaprenyltransferase [bacterium]